MSKFVLIAISSVLFFATAISAFDMDTFETHYCKYDLPKKEHEEYMHCENMLDKQV
jgi:hypothetical protein